jgi:hypothetical protein
MAMNYKKIEKLWHQHLNGVTKPVLEQTLQNPKQNMSLPSQQAEKTTMFETMYNTLCEHGKYTVFEFIEYVKEQLKENTNNDTKIIDKIRENDIMMNRLEDGSFMSEEHSSLVMRERIHNTHFLCDNA